MQSKAERAVPAPTPLRAWAVPTSHLASRLSNPYSSRNGRSNTTWYSGALLCPRPGFFGQKALESLPLRVGLRAGGARTRFASRMLNASIARRALGCLLCRFAVLPVSYPDSSRRGRSNPCLCGQGYDLTVIQTSGSRQALSGTACSRIPAPGKYEGAAAPSWQSAAATCAPRGATARCFLYHLECARRAREK